GLVISLVGMTHTLAVQMRYPSRLSCRTSAARYCRCSRVRYLAAVGPRVPSQPMSPLPGGPDLEPGAHPGLHPGERVVHGWQPRATLRGRVPAEQFSVDVVAASGIGEVAVQGAALGRVEGVDLGGV